MTFTKGTFVYLTNGEYSDYSVRGFCIVLRDFTEEEVQKEYREQYSYDYYTARTQRLPLPVGLFQWLLDKGYTAEIAAEEFHTDD